MRFEPLQTLATALVAAATASANHVVHEKRDTIPTGWTKRERVESRAILPLRIGLRQRNLDRADELLDSVSNPKSSKYAQHWSAKEVAEMFAPSDDSVTSVISWLTESGIDAARIAVTAGKSWVTVNASVHEVETLIEAEYHIYEHESGQLHVAADSYSLPAALSAQHVDIVMPTLHFDAKLHPGRKGSGDALRRKRTTGPSAGAKAIGKNAGTLPKMGKQTSQASLITELEQCDEQIVPDCLRALYSMPVGDSSEEGNSMGVVEYTPQSYLPQDLDLFFSNFSKDQVGDRPILDSIDGGVPLNSTDDLNYNVESNLDLEYAMALVYPQTVTLYQTGDDVEGASFNNFLDAIDGSYCTYEGGNDPLQDGIYPDPYGGGYEGPETCGAYSPTNVISTSYAYNEADLTPFYEMRQCNEYMKLGLQGVTVLYSSGDYGVAGNSGQCINADGTYNSGSSGRFNPSFPGTCPYITSVGATEVPEGTNIVEALASGTQPEIACETVIYSGGGFSNVFPMPSYQESAVSDYLETYPPPYGADRYNNTGKTRAFPDVSANGANYIVAIQSDFYFVYGTSASCPTFGALVTLINEQRLKAGKSPVGFINPALYANAAVMKDVVSGGNQGCGTAGFEAVPGWDPVTGLGTPDYNKMLELFLSLP